ncbi:MAG: CinA family protein, partial [Firmicutes bacterium]|nr:CinA family protein [Bacillota bacterium]
ASYVFKNGIVSYAEEAKMKFLGVKSETLEKYSAVSYQTAEEMCRGAALNSNTDIGISTTGYAGPGGGTEKDPAGTVYIGIYIKGNVFTERLSLSGTRNEVRQKATQILLEKLANKISEM